MPVDKMTDPISNFLGIKTSMLIAGLVGGVVRALIRPTVTLAQSVGGVVAGAASAAYLTPLAMLYAGISPPGEHAVAFLFGLVGMIVCDGVIVLATRWRKNPTLPPLK